MCVFLSFFSRKSSSSDGKSSFPPPHKPSAPHPGNANLEEQLKALRVKKKEIEKAQTSKSKKSKNSRKSRKRPSNPAAAPAGGTKRPKKKKKKETEILSSPQGDETPTRRNNTTRTALSTPSPRRDIIATRSKTPETPSNVPCFHSIRASYESNDNPNHFSEEWYAEPINATSWPKNCDDCNVRFGGVKYPVSTANLVWTCTNARCPRHPCTQGLCDSCFQKRFANSGRQRRRPKASAKALGFC